MMKYLWILVILSASSAFGQNAYGPDYLNFHCTSPDPKSSAIFNIPPAPGLVPNTSANGNAILYCDAASNSIKLSFSGSQYVGLAGGNAVAIGAKGDAQQYLDGSISQGSPIFTTGSNRFALSDVGKMLSTLIQPVPIEIYTNYTKNDPGSVLSVTSTGVSGTNIPQANTALLFKDYGTGFFNGNFTHFLDIKDTHGGSGSSFSVFWALANGTNGPSTTGDLYIQINNNGASPTLFLIQAGGNSSTLTLSDATQYWLTITLSGTTLTCNVYSNSNRTTLVGSPSITISGTTAWRYVYAYANFGGSGTSTATILSENLNISGLTVPTVFTSTIASFQSATQVTLTTNAPGAGSTLEYAWGTDNTAPFNSALQAASAQNISVVSVPPGVYLFSGPISIPDGVTLKGTVSGPFLPRQGIPTNVTTIPQLWATNTTDTAFIKMFVRQNATANSNNIITGLSDTTKLRLGQAVQIVNGSGTAGLLPNSGGAFITSIDSSSQIHVSQTASFSGACTLTAAVNNEGVEDLLIYHPVQVLDSATTPIVFPPAIQIVGGNGYHIRRVTTVNAYTGIANGWGDTFTYGIFTGSGYLDNLFLGALSVGIATDHSSDVVHAHGIHLMPIYDQFGPNQTTPHDLGTTLDTWVQANGTGLTFYRADQPQFVDTLIFLKNTAVSGTTSPDTNIANNTSYVNFTNLAIDTIKFGVTVTAAQGPWSISNLSASSASGVSTGGNMLATSGSGVKMVVFGGNVITNGWSSTALSQGASSTLVVSGIVGISSDGLFVPPVNALASLAACTATVEGAHAVANNCNAACTVGGTCTAGGTTHCELYCNSAAAYVETGR